VVIRHEHRTEGEDSQGPGELNNINMVVDDDDDDHRPDPAIMGGAAEDAGEDP